MNRKGKSWPLFVVAILIVLFSLTAILGVSYTYGDTKNVYVKGASDIRFGIDIRGGVDVTFMPADDVEATEAQMTAAKTVIEDRLVGLGDGILALTQDYPEEVLLIFRIAVSFQQNLPPVLFSFHLSASRRSSWPAS